MLNTTALGRHPPSEAAGRVGNRAFSEFAGEGWSAVDRPSCDADAPPQPRYRGLTLPKLRLGRVKLVAIIEKCRKKTYAENSRNVTISASIPKVHAKMSHVHHSCCPLCDDCKSLTAMSRGPATRSFNNVASSDFVSDSLGGVEIETAWTVSPADCNA